MDNLIGGQLYARLAELLAPPGSLAGGPAVLLVEPSGKDVDPGDFGDAHGAGDPDPASEALADLVNSVPIPGPTFVDSSRCYDDVFQLIVEGAVTSGDASDPVSANAARMLQDARFTLQASARARHDDPIDAYHPVRTSPARWWAPTTPWPRASFTIGASAASAAAPTAPTPTPTPATTTATTPDARAPRIQRGGLVGREVRPATVVQAGPPIEPARAAVDPALLPIAAPPLAWRSVSDDAPAREIARLVCPDRRLSLAQVRALSPQPGLEQRLGLWQARIAAARAVAPAPHAAWIDRTRAMLRGKLGPASPDAAVRAAAPNLARGPATGGDAAQTGAAFSALALAPARLRYRDLLQIARALDTGAKEVHVEPAEGGFQVSFEYCVVTIERPWFHRELFDLPGWTLPGLAAHAISNGQATNNLGLLPAVTTRFLAVRNLVVHASWTSADRATAAQAGKAAGLLSFGPFALTGDSQFDGVDLRHPGPQIVAWLAAILPPCPA